MTNFQRAISYLPEPNEILQRASGDVQTEERGVAEEQDEEFIVPIGDATVRPKRKTTFFSSPPLEVSLPRAMMIVAKNTAFADRTVMRAIGFDALTDETVPNA